MFKFAELVPEAGGPVPTVQVLAATISFAGYSVVIGLSIESIRHLLKPRTTHSRFMKIFLFSYISIMFSLSTLALAQECIYIFKNFPAGNKIASHDSQPAALFDLFDVPISLPLAILGADIFMTWRCIMLYGGAGRRTRIFVIWVLVLLALVSLGSGIFFFVQPIFSSVNGVILIAILTTSTNTTLSFLIGLRLVHYEGYLSKLMGLKRGSHSPYRAALTICVESCALIAAVSLVFIILYYTTHSAFLFPLVLLPHICVLSPFLVIFWVAQGRSTSAMVENSQIITPNLVFNNSISVHPLDTGDSSVTDTSSV